MKENVPAAGKAHTISLTDRERCELTGVSDVDLFNEEMISAATDRGYVKITGSGLHVESLNLEKGLLSITGHVDSLSYDDRHVKTGKSLMGRIFR